MSQPPMHASQPNLCAVYVCGMSVVLWEAYPPPIVRLLHVL